MSLYIPSAPFYHLLWIFLGSFVIGLLFAAVAGALATVVEQYIASDSGLKDNTHGN